MRDDIFQVNLDSASVEKQNFLQDLIMTPGDRSGLGSTCPSNLAEESLDVFRDTLPFLSIDLITGKYE